MLKQEVAKSGDHIIVVDERYTASKYHPKKEAEVFVDSISVDLQQFDHIVLLGAGSGYHIERLKEIYPHLKILVIEKSRDVINWNNDYHRFEDVTFQSSTVDSEEGRAFIQSILFQTFFIQISPGYAQSPDWGFYESYQQLMLARTQASLQSCLEIMKIEENFPRINQDLKNACLTIKDLDAVSESEGYVGNLNTDLQILKELVS